jgi:hypothetical protein
MAETTGGTPSVTPSGWALSLLVVACVVATLLLSAAFGYVRANLHVHWGPTPAPAPVNPTPAPTPTPKPFPSSFWTPGAVADHA